MTIKSILEEISSESSTNKKQLILSKYKNNILLFKIINLACSKRVKFYIKQIPEPQDTGKTEDLDWAISQLSSLSTRKYTGGEAIAFLQRILGSISSEDQYVICRIIEKDLKIGMGSATINKVFPNTISKTPYMGAKPFSNDLVDKLFAAGTVISDIKMDGRYCNAIIRDGDVELESRQGEKTFVGDAQFFKDLSLFPDCVLNGELTIIGMDRYEANGVITSVIDIEEKREKRSEKETSKKVEAFVKKHGNYQEVLDRITYTVWDRIAVDEYFSKKSTTPYSERKATLKSDVYYAYKDNNDNDIKVALIESRPVSSKAEAFNHFTQALDRGLEGTVLKAEKGQWKDGKPTWQVKMKLEINLDLKIVGFNYGKKGTKNEHVISTLRTESSCGLLKTNPAGMDEAMMKFVTANQEELLGTIVEIRCCGLSTDKDGNWSTLHPSVVVLRGDKDTCDSLEDCQKIENMSKLLN